jgi:hypothetical protein
VQTDQAQLFTLTRPDAARKTAVASKP